MLEIKSTKFKLIKETNGEMIPGYNGVMLKTGDTIELSGNMAVKATFNPNYEIVPAKQKKQVRKKVD